MTLFSLIYFTFPNTQKKNVNVPRGFLGFETRTSPAGEAVL